MRRIAFAFVLLLTVAPLAAARVTRVEIKTREDVNRGEPFGLAGPYERLIGKVYLEVDPRNPHNGVIVDLDKADRDQEGLVDFSADVYILKPKNPNRASGSLLVEIPNRGGRVIVRLVNFATRQSEFGDGFLMRQGITVVWVGWQFDVRDQEGLLRLYAPVARDGARPITGLLRSDPIVQEKSSEQPLAHIVNGTMGGTEYPVADGSDAADILTVRETPTSERRAIPKTDWSFAHSIYFFAGLQHFSGAFPPRRGTALTLLGQHPQNPNPISWFWRAMIVNMDERVRDGVAPPPSSYPRLDDGTLVARVSFIGSYLPLAKTQSDREKRGDPRASLEEHYQSEGQYLGLYAESAMDLIQRRFLLREDLAGIPHRGNLEME